MPVTVTAIRGNTAGIGRISALAGISMGGPTSYWSDGTFGRHLQIGVSRDAVQGNPTAPSLALAQPGFWRFRWSLTAGTHTISVLALQLSGLTPRPTMIIKANPAIGVASDVVGTASGGVSWVTIGPISATASSIGAVWVELWNNLYAKYDAAYFDHIVAT